MPYLRTNTDAPFGAMPHGPVLRIGYYSKDASASAIYAGDFVILESDGAVAVAAAGNTLLGVAAKYSAASTADDQFPVYDHPDQQFVVQCDDGGTALAATTIGNNADILATTGDTTTLRSLHELDQSDITDSTANLRIVKAHPIEDSPVGTPTFGANRKVIVLINEHYYRQVTGI